MISIMRCPNCGSVDDKVIESRTMSNGESIRRRRECITCGYRFTSYERIEEKPLMVIKRGGKKQLFDRSKLGSGIQRAIEKRPVTQEQIDMLLNEVEDKALQRAGAKRESPASDIGEIAMNELFSVDKVAYIRFTSVYKHFENLEEFITEIKKTEKKQLKEKSQSQ